MSDAQKKDARTKDAAAGSGRKKPLMIAGLLIIVGLVVEAFTLTWSHPTAFLLFALVGFGFVVLGILVYLWTILFARPGTEPAPEPATG